MEKKRNSKYLKYFLICMGVILAILAGVGILYFIFRPSYTELVENNFNLSAVDFVNVGYNLSKTC